MAVKSTVTSSSMVIAVKTGQEDGKAKSRSETFSNISPSAKDEDIYEVGKAIGNLSAYAFLNVSRKNTCSLTEDSQSA